MSDDEEPLPGMPEPPDVPPTDARSTPQLCQACIGEIHRDGVGVAPYPQLARWRVTLDDHQVAALCLRHLTITIKEMPA